MTEIDKLKQKIIELEAVRSTDAPQRFNINELIEYLPSDVKRATIYKWIALKKVPFYKTPGTQMIFFVKSEIDQWLIGQEVKHG